MVGRDTFLLVEKKNCERREISLDNRESSGGGDWGGDLYKMLLLTVTRRGSDWL